MYGDAKIIESNGKLILNILPAPDLIGDLTHWHHDVFKIIWRKQFAWFDEGYIQFIMNPAGDIVEFKLDVPNDDFWFEELEFKRKNVHNAN